MLRLMDAAAENKAWCEVSWRINGGSGRGAVFMPGGTRARMTRWQSAIICSSCRGDKPGRNCWTAIEIDSESE